MLHKHLRDEWYARIRAVPSSPVLTFAPEGLVLGAGTVILAADRPRRLQSLRGQEPLVLALLSAACGKAVAPSVLGNIERAAKAWNEGDGCLAYIHLSYAGLPPLSDFQTGAYRLLMARCAMMHGASPRAVFQALHLDPRYIDAVEKGYNPAEPRVPAGSGKTSGEWTDSDGGSEDSPGEDSAGDGTAKDGTTTNPTTEEYTHGSSLLSRAPLPAPTVSFLGRLTAAQVAELGTYALRVLRVATPAGAAAAVFWLLFIPSPNDLHVEGDVPEIPGLRYSWNLDEARLLLKYDRPGAQRTVALHIRNDDLLDEEGRVVGKIFGGNRVAIDTVAVLPDVVKQDEPRLCPAPAPDVAGSDQGKPYSENRARQYEDFVKRLINPPPNVPTPSGFVYYLPDPGGGKPVSYDDCKKTNGVLFEIKGLRNAQLSSDLPGVMAADYLKQAKRQADASEGRPIVWIFAEKDAALFARDLFDRNDLGRITVAYVPWIRSARQ